MPKLGLMFKEINLSIPGVESISMISFERKLNFLGLCIFGVRIVTGSNTNRKMHMHVLIPSMLSSLAGL